MATAGCVVPWRVKAAIKRTVPRVSRVCRTMKLLPVVGEMETYLAQLQGKGASVGRNLQAEVAAAARFIHRASAVVFDVGAHRGHWSLAMAGVLGDEALFV